MIVLSPRAIERLNTYHPDRPLPKIFRVKKNGKVDMSIFEGNTINTPSMLCVADYLKALEWVNNIGGLKATINKSNNNLNLL